MVYIGKYDVSVLFYKEVKTIFDPSNIDYNPFQMSLIFDSENHYCRSTSPEQIALCQKLSDRYKAVVYVVPSGMNAISVLLNSLIPKRYTFVYADELYTDCNRLFKDLAHRYDMNCHSINITNSEAIAPLVRDGPVILYFESCSNPHGQMFDFNLLSQWKQQNPQLLVICDNTWLTSAVFNPLDHGADYVISSLAKYYSNGQAQGGLIAGRNLGINNVEVYIRYHGIHTSRVNCQRISDEIDNLFERMTKAYNVTQEVISLLKADANFKDICYPSQYYDAKIGPSVFTVKMKGNRKVLKHKIASFEHIKDQTSFGSAETKLDPWHIITKGGYTEVRIAIGYKMGSNNAEAVYSDLIR